MFSDCFDKVGVLAKDKAFCYKVGVILPFAMVVC